MVSWPSCGADVGPFLKKVDAAVAAALASSRKSDTVCALLRKVAWSLPDQWLQEWEEGLPLMGLPQFAPVSNDEGRNALVSGLRVAGDLRRMTGMSCLSLALWLCALLTVPPESIKAFQAQSAVLLLQRVSVRNVAPPGSAEGGGAPSFAYALTG